MKTITTPQAHAARLRTALRPNFSRDDSHTAVRINHRPFPELTIEERLTVLAQIAGLFREMAEQCDEERLLIAQEELAA